MASVKADDGRASAQRMMREALIRELKEEGGDSDGRRTANVLLVARALIAKAIGGEAAAIKEIFDRVDGRAGTPDPAAPRGLSHEEALKLLL